MYSSALYSALPDVAPDPHVLEQPARSISSAESGVSRAAGGQSPLVALADRVVHLLDFGEERIEALGARV